MNSAKFVHFQAIKGGMIESNFIGVGLGDAWVDPITIVLEWAPYLLAFVSMKSFTLI